MFSKLNVLFFFNTLLCHFKSNLFFPLCTWLLCHWEQCSAKAKRQCIFPRSDPLINYVIVNVKEIPLINSTKNLFHFTMSQLSIIFGPAHN